MPVHALPVMLDEARVLADEQPRELVDCRGNRTFAPLQRRLTQANEAIVGLYLDKMPVLALDAHQSIADGSDLHSGDRWNSTSQRGRPSTLG
jgi:hypothetical protein